MMVSTRVPVLMYHQVHDPENEWEARYFISPRDFASHMSALARSGYQAVGIDMLVDWLLGGAALPARSPRPASTATR